MTEEFVESNNYSEGNLTRANKAKQMIEKDKIVNLLNLTNKIEFVINGLGKLVDKQIQNISKEKSVAEAEQSNIHVKRLTINSNKNTNNNLPSL